MHAAKYLFYLRAGLRTARRRPAPSLRLSSARLADLQGGNNLAGLLDGHRFTPSHISGDLGDHDDAGRRCSAAELRSALPPNFQSKRLRSGTRRS